MIENIDHIIIAVEDLKSAEENYTKIFGIEPVWRGVHNELGTSNILFNFENTYFELLAATGSGVGADLVKNSIKKNGDGLLGLVLGTRNLKAFKNKATKFGYLLSETSQGAGESERNEKRKWLYQFLPPEITRGIFSFVIKHKSKRLPFIERDKSTIKKLEQVVVKTNDCDGFIKVYKELYGIRLALDSFVEAWKKRMLFFRLNKTTIEVIEEKNNKVIPADFLWGLAWGVRDINSARERLLKNNIEVSDIKKGLKKDTLVATIKSHTNNVPTLLIEHTKRA
ncbi:MAG: glyoxalase-like domain protein [Gammaproteobacteria bacterium TMED112]|nr:MAG: glyoxalase-like domain protein [Gammaproteobacteria bacterium TMED112]|tara:strand:+ start:603 stop:1448 length:846 start_codon:yes stop_codon:yes gene_type:complete